MPRWEPAITTSATAAPSEQPPNTTRVFGQPLIGVLDVGAHVVGADVELGVWW